MAPLVIRSHGIEHLVVVDDLNTVYVARKKTDGRQAEYTLYVCDEDGIRTEVTDPESGRRSWIRSKTSSPSRRSSNA